MSELDLDRILRVAAESSGYDEIVIDQLVAEVRRLRGELSLLDPHRPVPPDTSPMIDG